MAILSGLSSLLGWVPQPCSKNARLPHVRFASFSTKDPFVRGLSRPPPPPHPPVGGDLRDYFPFFLVVALNPWLAPLAQCQGLSAFSKFSGLWSPTPHLQPLLPLSPGPWEHGCCSVCPSAGWGAARHSPQEHLGAGGSIACSTQSKSAQEGWGQALAASRGFTPHWGTVLGEEEPFFLEFKIFSAVYIDISEQFWVYVKIEKVIQRCPYAPHPVFPCIDIFGEDDTSLTTSEAVL